MDRLDEPENSDRTNQNSNRDNEIFSYADQNSD